MDGIDLDELIQLHNEARDEGSWTWEIMPLLKDDKLMQYAQAWAEQMAKVNRMYHSSMQDLMKIGFSAAGENVAWGQKDCKTVMRTWLNSPGHRANIMSTKYSVLGCGVARSSKGRIFWCTCFGTPADGRPLIYGPRDH